MKGATEPWRRAGGRSILGILVLIGLVVTGARPTAADLEAGREKAAACAACHGADGNASNPAIPSLAGQPMFYTHWQLVLFRDGRRHDPQMSPFAANLSDADMADLAAYYAAQKSSVRPARPGDADTATAGRRLAQVHHCASCHASELTGQRYTPHLAGQSYEYLVKQLREFKARTRGELDGVTMTLAAQPLTEQEIEILARFYASLAPAPSTPGGAR